MDSDLPPDRPGGGFGYVFLVVFTAVVAARAGWLAGAEPAAVVDLFADDAYYYFGIARNVWQRGMVSFDGLEPTSGFHPLWLANLLPFFGLDLGRVGVLRAVGVYSLALYVVAVVAAGRYLYRSFGVLGATASLCFGIGVADDVFAAGMETSLAIPLAVLSLLHVDRRCVAPYPSEGADGRFLLLGLLLSLLQLARLDAVLLGAITVGAVCLVHVGRAETTGHQTLGIGLRAAGPMAVSGAAYLAFNVWLTGCAVPISVRVKTMGDHLLNWKYLNLLVNHPAWTPVAMATVGGAVWCGWVIASGRGGRGTVHPRDAAGLCSAAFMVVFSASNLLSSTWSLWIWYQYPLVLFAFFAVPRIVEEASVGGLSGDVRSTGAAVLFVVTLVGVPVVQFASAPDRAGASFKLLNRAAAEEMNRRLGPDSMQTVVAMGERAGSFGYFFDGHVVHMEGLVGTTSTLRAIRRDRMAAFLDRRGVDMLVDYGYLDDEYGEARITVPRPGLHLGPRAGLRVCRETEWYRWRLEGARVADATLRAWQWPSCTAEGSG
ncbi:MAG: hypothetical protein ABEL76_11705 [Bradymonadaceae bacterium]